MTDEQHEHCTRCGDEITDTNQSEWAGDDLCADCRFEVEAE
jgi:hypothetical protein